MAMREEVAADSPIVVIDLDARPPPLAAVRRRIAEGLTGLASPELYAVLLIATELVTNAYEHAWFPYQLRLWRFQRTNLVRVEVDDISPYPPVLGRSRLGETRGHGLRLVEHFATGWGMIRRSVGKTVWAHVALREWPTTAPPRAAFPHATRSQDVPPATGSLPAGSGIP